ncbi:putative uncharacterized protein DDB_G0285119 isoform X2 [Episyrphus balteatus]|uniref:putative uncharacterized protein DDB_G0285119 isoform X2 n=1 Tax=Episyrphus balteatus TaxID=286459 RepID=UPI002486C1B4|nr:putative uncharacterized protein DDB_G0285119 isoform X2 [Episyrphus balteatus]
MQAITIVCSVLFVIVDFTQAQDDISNSLYTTRYERLDIDTILASPRLVTNYVECLLNKKPCAPEGKALKRILPEALRTKCGRCHPSQKEVALKVITALYFDYPQYYKALQERWDPSGDYNKRFEEYLRDQKFNSIGGGDSEAGEQAQRPTRQGANNQTQGQEAKPSAAPSTDNKELPAILNRFGADDEDGYDYEKPTVKTTTQAPSAPAPQQPSKSQQPQKPQQQPSAPSATSAPSRRPSSNNNGNNSPSSGGSSKPTQNTSGGSNPTHTWTHNNHPTPSTTTTYYLKTQNPVLNIINRITQKFANTAEFIAGMLRGAVPQPQAPIHKDDILRKFCDRLRKTILSHTNNNQNEKKYYHGFY